MLEIIGPGPDLQNRVNLAIWEPRSFRSVVAVTAFKENQSFDEGGLQANHPGPGVDVIPEGKL